MLVSIQGASRFSDSERLYVECRTESLLGVERGRISRATVELLGPDANSMQWRCAIRAHTAAGFVDSGWQEDPALAGALQLAACRILRAMPPRVTRPTPPPTWRDKLITQMKRSAIR